MLTMTPRKNRAMPEPSRSLRARDKGIVVPYTVEMTPEHFAALEACRKKQRRTKKEVVLLALERYFADDGLWPPVTTPTR